MKKLILSVLITFTALTVWSQDPLLFEKEEPNEDRNFRIPLIGESAPTFTAQTTNGELRFPEDYGKSWKILFSHPQDFTPVCTTELMELAKKENQFEKLNVKIAALSTDKLSTHELWKKAMESLMYKDNKAGSINFPLIDDENLSISKRYGMIHPESNTTRDVRGVFIIDPENKIQAIYFYPMNVGRNTDELIRMITALEKTSTDDVFTPVNWKSGEDVLVPTIPDHSATKEQLAAEGLYNKAWFLWYKKTQ